MKRILVFGAGKSSSYLIRYLINNAKEYNWIIQIVDKNTDHIKSRFGEISNVELFNLDILAGNDCEKLISNAAVVISLLPPFLHIHIAKNCLKHSKNLITASYVSDEIRNMDAELKAKGVLFMCEMGLDPGIDHMSAMQIMEKIKMVKGEIKSFKSHCGGLISPESDTNPWHYKISWNPRNVITAGQAGAQFLIDKKAKDIPYQQMFENSKQVYIDDQIGHLAYYPNRDSLDYLDLYNLQDIDTLVRTTLRYPAFNKAWHFIVQLNLTNEKDIHQTANLTYLQWLQTVLNVENVENKLNELFADDADSKTLFQYLDLTSSNLINIGDAKSSADILQHVIEQKWKLEDTDKDMIVMQHEFNYNVKHIVTELKSTLIVKGEDKIYTAMAKTVGLPMAIFAKLLITNKITRLTGVQIPVMAKVYNPVLKELEAQNIIFTETIK